MSKFAWTWSTSSWSSSASIRRSSLRASSAPTSTVVFGQHRLLGRLDLHPALLQRCPNRAQVAGIADDPKRISLARHVLGAGVDRGHQVILGIALGVDEHDPPLLEHPGHRPGLAQARVRAGKNVPDRRVRPRPDDLAGNAQRQDERGGAPDQGDLAPTLATLARPAAGSAEQAPANARVQRGPANRAELAQRGDVGRTFGTTH